MDEPEIHLHPAMIQKLVEVMLEIAENEGKQFLISTHSEHFVEALLNLLVKKEAVPDDFNIFYLKKDKKETTIERQKINEHGQISGGLSHFYETELENMKTFFKIYD